MIHQRNIQTIRTILSSFTLKKSKLVHARANEGIPIKRAEQEIRHSVQELRSFIKKYPHRLNHQQYTFSLSKDLPILNLTRKVGMLLCTQSEVGISVRYPSNEMTYQLLDETFGLVTKRNSNPDCCSRYMYATGQTSLYYDYLAINATKNLYDKVVFEGDIGLQPIFVSYDANIELVSDYCTKTMNRQFIIYAHSDIFNELTNLVLSKLKKLKGGNPYDHDVDIDTYDNHHIELHRSCCNQLLLRHKNVTITYGKITNNNVYPFLLINNGSPIRSINIQSKPSIIIMEKLPNIAILSHIMDEYHNPLIGSAFGTFSLDFLKVFTNSFSIPLIDPKPFRFVDIRWNLGGPRTNRYIATFDRTYKINKQPFSFITTI